MTRITYSRELLLSYNTPACQSAPLAVPAALRISTYPQLATLFNNRHGFVCRPIEPLQANNDLDPSSGGAGVVCAC